jgi:HAD superfamily hydrolase (TIGR01509 family)
MKAVVFDFDGVIIDTETARYEAWQKIYSSYGCILPLDIWVQSIGKAQYAIHPYDYLLQNINVDIDYAEITALHKKLEVELADKLPLLPGVKARIDEAKELGMALAVVSSSSRAWVGGHLRRRGLYDKFEVLVCRDDTEQHKPSPVPYLKAVNILGCEAAQAFAIEDSPTGIEAAVSAGLFCIGVGCSMTINMDLSRANLIVKSLEEISLSSLSKSRYSK